MNLSLARMDQHKGRSKRTQERTEAQYYLRRLEGP